jgi:hypothetical protein
MSHGHKVAALSLAVTLALSGVVALLWLLGGGAPSAPPTRTAPTAWPPTVQAYRLPVTPLSRRQWTPLAPAMSPRSFLDFHSKPPFLYATMILYQL